MHSEELVGVRVRVRVRVRAKVRVRVRVRVKVRVRVGAVGHVQHLLGLFLGVHPMASVGLSNSSCHMCSFLSSATTC